MDFNYDNCVYFNRVEYFCQLLKNSVIFQVFPASENEYEKGNNFLEINYLGSKECASFGKT